MGSVQKAEGERISRWREWFDAHDHEAELLAACKHVEAMAGDAYLDGHPEWEVIVDEARDAIAKAEGK